EMSKRTYEFPYLKDADGAMAKRFGAVCTPHAFLVDRDLRVLYDGRIDDSRLGDSITSRDLENPIADLLAAPHLSVRHTHPFGCSIVGEPPASGPPRCRGAVKALGYGLIALGVVVLWLSRSV